jgi:hypothetical protein
MYEKGKIVILIIMLKDLHSRYPKSFQIGILLISKLLESSESSLNEIIRIAHKIELREAHFAGKVIFGHISEVIIKRVADINMQHNGVAEVRRVLELENLYDQFF